MGAWIIRTNTCAGDAGQQGIAMRVRRKHFIGITRCLSHTRWPDCTRLMETHWLTCQIFRLPATSYVGQGAVHGGKLSAFRHLLVRHHHIIPGTCPYLNSSHTSLELLDPEILGLPWENIASSTCSPEAPSCSLFKRAPNPHARLTSRTPRPIHPPLPPPSLSLSLPIARHGESATSAPRRRFSQTDQQPPNL